jgi:hypothetical protein
VWLSDETVILQSFGNFGDGNWNSVLCPLILFQQQALLPEN